ncbi:MAG TPA: peptidylprolyl isomerase [Flavobacteriaceae bacterium]|nr:peptidylprolyl isomerase [Flavobacteriaceae bacterium]
MLSFKTPLKLALLFMVITVGSCQEKYPDLEDGLYAEFVTSKGTMLAKLFHEKVPVTVANFVALAEGTHPKLPDSLKGKPFYNGVTFHRVMDKFMIQGGDPTATGTGSPGYVFEDEFDITLKHDKPGVLSMANPSANANGSQFFITEVPTPWLDGFDEQGAIKNCEDPRVYCHSIFGELIQGEAVRDTISNVAVDKSNNKPLEDVIIHEINIIRKGKEAKAFDAATVFTEQAPLLAEKLQKLKDEAETKLKEKSKLAADAFIEKNKDYPGTVTQTETGLVILLNAAEDGKKPSSADKVLIDCAGYFEDGRLFYTTWKEVAEQNNMYNEQAAAQGAYEPFAMPYNNTATLVPGFREAMLSMNIGDKARVFIPSYLGYGPRGNGPIPPDTNLVFDIELVGIQK